MNIIFYLFPAILATGILFKLGFKESWFNLIIFSSSFAIIICLLNYSVLFFGFGYDSIVLNTMLTSVSFGIKYLIISIFWALLLPMLTWNIDKNISLKVEEKVFLNKKHKKENE